MNYRNILIVTLIILIIAAGYFFYKDIELDPQNAIVSYIEEATGYEINYSSAKLWPLNELTIENLNLVGDNFILKVPKLNVGYSIFDYLNETQEVGRIVKYINMDNPELIYNSVDTTQTEESLSFNEIRDLLLQETEDLYLNIKDGSIYINQADNNYEVNSLDTEIAISSSDKNIKVDIKKGFQLKGLLLDKYRLENYTTDNFRISAELNNESWDLYLKNDKLELAQFNTLIKDNITEELTDFQIENIEGTTDLDLHVQGQNEEIINYKTNIELVDGKFDFKLEDKNFSDSVNISRASFHLNSNNNELYIRDLNFNINNSDFNFAGYYNIGSTEYTGKLVSKNFQVNSDYVNNFLKESLESPYSTDGILEVNLDGNLDKINLLADIKLNNLSIRDHMFEDINASIRYVDDSLYLDNLELQTVNDGRLKARGLYNLSKKGYQLDIEAEDVRPSVYYNEEKVRNFVEEYNLTEYLKGEADFNLTITGTSQIEESIVKADINFTPDRENILRANGVRTITSQLLYEDNKLYINDGKLMINGDRVNIFGNFDLKNNNFYVKVRGENIGLAFLNNSIETPIPEGNKVSIDTLVQGNFTDPFVKGTVKSNELTYDDYSVNNVSIDFSYNKNSLNVSDINFNFENIKFNGSGVVNIPQDYNLAESTLDFTVNTDNIAYSKAKEYIDFTLPIKGEVKPEIQLSGNIDELKVNGKLMSNNTQVSFNEQVFAFDHVEAELMWSLGNKQIKLENGIIRKEDLNIVTQGTFREEYLDLDFTVSNFNIEEIKLVENVSGIFTMDGKVVGEFNNPRVNINFSTDNFRYHRFTSDEFTGQITYNDDTITFKGVNLKKGNSLYNIDGSINKLSKNQILDIYIKTEKGNINDILNLTDYDIPYQMDYFFSGTTNLCGNFSQPQVDLDLSILNNEMEIIDLKGSISDKIDLAFNGSEVPLDLINISSYTDYDFSYGGMLKFSGNMTGSIEDFNIEANTEINNLKVSNINLNNLQGKIAYNSQGTFMIDQTLRQAEEQTVEIDGNIDLNQRNIETMQVNINNYRLNKFTTMNGGIQRLRGYINGDISLTGDISRPQLSGNVSLNAPELNISGIAPIENLTGNLIFTEEKINLEGIKGNFGEGNFTLKGAINYTSRDNFWDIRLNGEDFYFDYGSYTGSYDPEVRLLNEFRKPLLFGDLLVHDFIINSELNWPVTESEEAGEPFFDPQLKLNLIPGKEVYFRDENIDIQVEEGNLRLNYLEGELTFIGQLASNEGSIDYYNNKFIIDNVTATFEQYSNNIPEIHLVGTTVTSGARVFIYVDGPADNLNISFGSQPELPRDRIIALLTQKGGLGNIMSEDGVDPSTLIRSELFRYVGEQFQLSFIQQVEQSFANIFSLDRFEIDTYSLAGEREVTIYLGKDITDKLYLQYTGIFSPENRENEVTFEYDINQYLNLEGGWYGEDDYRFILESTIEF